MELFWRPDAFLSVQNLDGRQKLLKFFCAFAAVCCGSQEGLIAPDLNPHAVKAFVFPHRDQSDVGPIAADYRWIFQGRHLHGRCPALVDVEAASG